MIKNVLFVSLFLLLLGSCGKQEKQAYTSICHDSFDNFLEKLQIDPRKDIEGVHVISKTDMEPIRKSLPEKYRKNFNYKLIVILNPKE